MIKLASTSPRRSELLAELGYPFSVVTPDFDEDIQDKTLPPYEYVCFLATQKGLSVAREPGDIIISADTIVVLDNHIYEKPLDAEDAFLMLAALRGKTHQVITAISIRSDKLETTYYEVSDVTMRNYTDQEIKDYVKSGEPFGKAGSYAIQGLASKLIESYAGELYTIVGLPLKKLHQILQNLV